ncbi:MAG TPA: M64 family metallopeptidase [Thermoanaerobaculia bacterium]|nr:M64 family metallopeptidase [Thermoanaerobaculia bacterium]
MTVALVQNIARRFAPAATQYVVLLNNGRPGGCRRSGIALFTRRESSQVIAHELGHDLFSLGDEYNNDTQNNTFVRGEPNLTETLADWNTLKWRDLVGAGTMIPTDRNTLPGGWNNNLSVGAFEGGGGNFSTGIFRPVVECRMNQNNPPWCPVCGRQINTVLGAFR